MLAVPWPSENNVLAMSESVESDEGEESSMGLLLFYYKLNESNERNVIIVLLVLKRYQKFDCRVRMRIEAAS